MADRVDSTIAALNVALKEAEKSREHFWKARRANCWINQLPGAWWGRWRHLKLRSDFVGEMQRVLFISDLRAVLAYLEAHREEIKIATAWPWSYSGRIRQPPPEPMDVDFSEVKLTGAKSSRKSKESVRLIKG
jgi:hypothetical protein